MTWKSVATAGVSGAGVLATWMGVLSTPAAPARDQAPATRSAPTSQAADIERQAEHLQARVHPDADYRTPSRNPFRFAERPAPRRVVTARPIEEATVPLQPSRPSIRVSGIATDVINGVARRTVVLRTDAGLVMVQEGEPSDGYAIRTIDDQGVELTTPDGSTIRLPFSNPESQIPDPKPQ